MPDTVVLRMPLAATPLSIQAERVPVVLPVIEPPVAMLAATVVCPPNQARLPSAMPITKRVFVPVQT